MEQPITNRPRNSYRGRFAPSPSGPLHFGSLIAALASYLDAKKHQGTWLVRIEDIDPPREQIGASDDILRTLEAFGLYWDESVLFQSQQSERYQQILTDLSNKKLTYYCQCTRAEIKAIGGIYQSHCRALNLSRKNCATRIINQSPIFEFTDRIQETVTCNKALAEEDFTLVRKDGLFAYQLAVVADDIYQGITDIVRGCDLLEPTARQLSFYQILNQSPPEYSHIPLATTEQGYKLSKQNKALAINKKNPQPDLFKALKFLGQNPPKELSFLTVEEIITWAETHWKIEQVPKSNKIAI